MFKIKVDSNGKFEFNYLNLLITMGYKFWKYFGVNIFHQTCLFTPNAAADTTLMDILQRGDINRYMQRAESQGHLLLESFTLRITDAHKKPQQLEDMEKIIKNKVVLEDEFVPGVCVSIKSKLASSRTMERSKKIAIEIHRLFPGSCFGKGQYCFEIRAT